MFVGINFSIYLSFLHYILYAIFFNSSIYVLMNALDKMTFFLIKHHCADKEPFENHS